MTWTSTSGAAAFFMVAGIAMSDGLQGALPKDSEYKPSWSIGQEWKVEVERMTEPASVPAGVRALFRARTVRYIYSFKVEGVRDIDGEPCVTLRVACVSIDGVAVADEVFYRVYMRQGNGMLMMVERVRLATQHVEASRKFSAVPVDATDWVGFLPMAWPCFALEDGRHVPTIRASAKGEAEYRNTDECVQEQQRVMESDGEKNLAALRVTLERPGDGGVPWRTTQIWVKGMPWWVKTRHDRGGKEWCTARLLRETPTKAGS